MVKKGATTSRKPEEEGQDSETEEDSDQESSSSDHSVTTAWYNARFDASQASTLTKESGEVSWQTVEISIRVAWDKGCMDVMGSEENKCKDGMYSHVKCKSPQQLAFDSQEVEEGQGSSKKGVLIRLNRIHGEEALVAASVVNSELIKAYITLKNRTHSLVEERENHRKLLQNNRRHERFRERNSSLVNPGRLKRKLQDDEGFEGDEEEEEEEEEEEKY
ncbi:hypothetical protein CBS101457_005725 [Exobasidium rhododendri]|nr:hypothetical protein CBS101457_005725 [Exobasidium rhododendri]